MKIIITAFFILLISTLGVTQNTFEIIIQDSLDQVSPSIIETEEYYIFSEVLGFFSTHGIKTKVYKTDKKGNIMLSRILKPETYEFEILNFFSDENNKFIGAGYQKYAVDCTAYFTMIKIDDNLRILTEKKYFTDFYGIDYINVEKSEDSYLIVPPLLLAFPSIV